MESHQLTLPLAPDEDDDSMHLYHRHAGPDGYQVVHTSSKTPLVPESWATAQVVTSRPSNVRAQELTGVYTTKGKIYLLIIEHLVTGGTRIAHLKGSTPIGPFESTTGVVNIKNDASFQFLHRLRQDILNPNCEGVNRKMFQQARYTSSYFGNVGLYCFDFSGNQLWSKRWESVPTRFGWGTAASPVLHGDRIYVVNDNDQESFLVALDKRTGAQIWRVERDEKSNWATPFIWQNEKRTEIVTSGTGKIRSYDLDGRLLWQLGGMSSITIPTPFTKHGLLYITSGYVMDKQKPLFAIRPGADGDITLEGEQTANEYVAWCQKHAGPYNTSPIVVGDYLYVLYDRGLIACYDAVTGAKIYGRRRIGRGARAFTSSPWAYDEKLFCLSEDGDTFVIQTGPEFKLLGKNQLDELCMATPAILGDGLIIRTEFHLIRIK